MIRTGCFVFLISAQLLAAQVVNDDESLRRALSEAQAGAVIALEAGTYRGGVSATLRGEKDRPIVIEAADEKRRPVIEGGGSGVHLTASRHVTVRRLKLRGATGNGINIDDGGKIDEPSVGIVLEQLDVQDVGPVGNCDGIKMSGVREFVVRDCFVSGWGGNAIDLVGCADGVIERCVVRGKKGFEPATGPQLKGGTRNVTVRQCLFDRAGARAINAGGSTGLPYFRPRDAAYEAKDLMIEDNVFVGSQAAVAFVGVDGAVFWHNTIVEPEKWVLRILQESRGQRFVQCRNVTFARNLIVYRRTAVRTAVNIGPGTQPATFVFAENWWWCMDEPGDRLDLPTEEAGGIRGRDPRIKFDESGWAAAAEAGAAAYGARNRSGPSTSKRPTSAD